MRCHIDWKHMRTIDELRVLRRRAGNLRARDLVALVEEQAYRQVRTSGGHHIYSKEGSARPIVIPDRPRTANTARGVINRLIRDLED